MWLPDDEKRLMICFAVSTQYRRVMDSGAIAAAAMKPRSWF